MNGAPNETRAHLCSFANHNTTRGAPSGQSVVSVINLIFSKFILFSLKDSGLVSMPFALEQYSLGNFILPFCFRVIGIIDRFLKNLQKKNIFIYNK